MINKLMYTQRKPRGFTLVETLVAVLALSLSLGALTLIASRSVVSARDAELRLQAELLAMEGIEVAQFAVLNEVLKNRSDINPSQVAIALRNNDNCTKGCGVIYNGSMPELSSQNLGSDYFDSSNNFAKVGNTATAPDVQFTNNYSGVIASPFKRLVVAKPSSLIVGGKGYVVRSIVYYTPVDALSAKRIVLTKEIQPWYLETVVVPPTTP